VRAFEAASWSGFKGGIEISCIGLVLLSIVYTGFSKAHAEGRLVSRCIPDQPQLPAIDRVKVKYFIVVGKAEAELREQLNQLGPVDQFGVTRDAYTRWHIRWNWPYKTVMRPDFSKLKVNYDITVTLPCWADQDSAEAELRQKWHGFIDRIIEHELGHISFVPETVKQIDAEIRAAFERDPDMSTATANKIGQEILAKARERDRDYDIRTMNGASDGVKFP